MNWFVLLPKTVLPNLSKGFQRKIVTLSDDSKGVVGITSCCKMPAFTVFISPMTKSQEKITVNFVSLGCPKNLVDSEIMLGLLNQDGHFRLATPEQPANVTVINSCSFVEESKQESIDTILEFAERKKTGDLDLLVVTGCLPQRYAQEIKTALPEVDLFVGTGEYPQLPGLIQHKLAGRNRKVYVEDPRYVPDHLTPRLQTTPFYTKYVKISEGCSHRCSFCIIPHIRGELNSRGVDDVFQEIQNGMNQGCKEFNLVAQDLNEYGRDLTDRPSLYKLLDKLTHLNGEAWIRLMYMYPLQFPKKLIQMIAEHPFVVPYVDIPLQHISDRMLKIMNRGSSSRYIYQLIDGLKTAMPEITIRTTFIAGHPGETHDDFLQLKKFITDMQFDRVGIFTYSSEEGTPASLFNDHVDHKIAESRRDELMSLQQEISLKRNQRFVGKSIQALYEGVAKDQPLLRQARHQGQAPDIDGDILITDGEAPLGDFCKVKITQVTEYDLVGKIVASK